jgi:hypothetical protein
MAIDYNDPVVAAEFAAVQPMSFEEVQEELMEKGIPVSQAMNDMDVKLMLVEMRLRLSGVLEGNKKQKRPAKFSSKLEEAMWTKVAFAAFYEDLKASGDNNSLNVVAEYINNKSTALQRYGKDYKALIRKTEAALAAPPPVKSNTLAFSGCKSSRVASDWTMCMSNVLYDAHRPLLVCFAYLQSLVYLSICFHLATVPANMGEQACRMTLESIGAISEFSCQPSDDFPVLAGKVTFEDIESAKKAVAQYDGMDMGMGTKLELTSV